MSLRSSRKILCVIFTLIITIGSVLAVSSLAARCTFGSQVYMEKIFASDSVKAKQDELFKKRLEVISSKSDIPVHVFDAVFNMDESYSESVMKRVFSGGDARMFSRDKIDLFEKLCVEYLQGNEIVYDAEQIHNTAIEAADAYADSYGMMNTESLTEFVNNISLNFGKYASTGLVIMAISAVLINVIFSERRDKVKNTAHSFSAAGFTLLLIGIVGAVLTAVYRVDAVPEVYADALSRAVVGSFLMTMIAGVIIVAISGFVTYKCFKSDQKEKRL